jgi:hypothetical protein
MTTVICPKCKRVVTIIHGEDHVICCNEVIYVFSENDSKIFFNEITSPSKPNNVLMNALSQYNKLKSCLQKRNH